MFLWIVNVEVEDSIGMLLLTMLYIHGEIHLYPQGFLSVITDGVMILIVIRELHYSGIITGPVNGFVSDRLRPHNLICVS